MNLRLYPMDIQECPLIIESCKYNRRIWYWLSTKGPREGVGDDHSRAANLPFLTWKKFYFKTLAISVAGRLSFGDISHSNCMTCPSPPRFDRLFGIQSTPSWIWLCVCSKVSTNAFQDNILMLECLYMVTELLCSPLEMPLILLLSFYPTASDAHTTADVDYRWKGGKSQGVEIVSKEMAQFDFVGAKTTTKANTNSKGTI